MSKIGVIILPSLRVGCSKYQFRQAKQFTLPILSQYQKKCSRHFNKLLLRSFGEPLDILTNFGIRSNSGKIPLVCGFDRAFLTAAEGYSSDISEVTWGALWLFPE